MSKGFDGWQNYYFEPEYDEDEGDEGEGYVVEDGQRDFSYEFETMDDPLAYMHYEWEEYKPPLWKKVRQWLRWHWRNKWWNACPDCHRPHWLGKHDNCIPF